MSNEPAVDERRPQAGNNELVVGTLEDLPPGTRKIVKVRNHEVGVYNVNGNFYALLNMCPHQFGPLCKGPVGGAMNCDEDTQWQFHWEREGEIVTCPWHGLEFDLTTGKSLATKLYSVRQFPVRVVDNEVRLQVR